MFRADWGFLQTEEGSQSYVRGASIFMSDLSQAGLVGPCIPKIGLDLLTQLNVFPMFKAPRSTGF